MGKRYRELFVVGASTITGGIAGIAQGAAANIININDPSTYANLIHSPAMVLVILPPLLLGSYTVLCKPKMRTFWEIYSDRIDEEVKKGKSRRQAVAECIQEYLLIRHFEVESSSADGTTDHFKEAMEYTKEIIDEEEKKPRNTQKPKQKSKFVFWDIKKDWKEENRSH